MFCNSVPVFKQAQDVSCLNPKGHKADPKLDRCLMYPTEDGRWLHSRESLTKEFSRLMTDLRAHAEETYEVDMPVETYRLLEDELEQPEDEEMCQYFSDVIDAVEAAHGAAADLLMVARALLIERNRSQGGT